MKKILLTTILTALVGGLFISCDAENTIKNPYTNNGDKVDDKPPTENDPDELQKDYPTLMGNNPIITVRYSADPTARVIGDELFVFPSSDIPGTENNSFNAFCMPYYYAYSTKNFFDWMDHGKLYAQEDVPWAIKDKYVMWAPDCVEYNDKFYHYFPTLALSNKGFKVGVAIADEPGGPYTVQPSYIEGTDNIDPNIFIDDDGSAYIIFKGDPYSKIAKLKPSMTEIEGEVKQLIVEGAGIDESKLYTEGPFIFKKGDTYYFTYAHSFNSARSSICYATSKNLFGPYTDKGVMLDPGDTWTSHHSIVKYNDEWILFYHNNYISHEDKLRSVCADYLHFNSDGTIKKVERTLRGIGVVPATREIQMDRYSSAYNVKIVQSEETFPANWMITEAKNDSEVIYDRVDFGNQTYKFAQLHYKCVTSKGVVTLSDEKTDEVIADFELVATAGGWKTIEVDISKLKARGVTNLKLTFSDVSVNAQFDWVQFVK